MKFNTLFVAAICAGTFFNSCVNKTAQERQLKYTHTSLVDGDGFAIFQNVGEAALSGLQYAEQAEATGDAKSKDVASKVKTFYVQFLPGLDSLATSVQIDFPIKGIPAVETAGAHSQEVDSTAHTSHEHQHHFDYVHQAQHELALIKEQLKRMTRNTNVSLQDFAKNQLPVVSELYTQIGGKEEAHGHH